MLNLFIGHSVMNKKMFVKQIGPFFCLYLFSALLNGRQRVPITDIKYTINSVANWQTVINFALNHDLLQRQRKKRVLCIFDEERPSSVEAHLGGPYAVVEALARPLFLPFGISSFLALIFGRCSFDPRLHPLSLVAHGPPLGMDV